MILESGGARHQVEVRSGQATGIRQVVVDGQSFEVEIEGQAPVFRVRIGERVETVHCVLDGSTIHLFWQGRAYRLTREPRATRSPEASINTLEAPMPGKVIAVAVTPGEAVRRGQPLVIIEAMKMETVVRAPRDGRVRAVRVAAGDRVAPGIALVELE
jgi:3-methylcrotonyl-CoA carboxylase alpha subunit